jgi:PAS domain S-box-containing protein
MVSPEGAIVNVNSAALKTLGYKKEELVGKPLETIYAPESLPRMQQIFEKWTETEELEDEELFIITKKGDRRTVLLSAGVVRTKDGKTVHSVSVQKDITKRKQAEQKMKEREVDLLLKSKELEEVNNALRVLLRRADEDKRELEEKVLASVKELVVFYIEKLKKSGLDAKQMAYVNTVESNLNEIISPFARRLSSKYLSLTPAEIHIANLVREGKNTKEIGQLLNLSPRTVESHRQSIRDKLGLKHRKANLRSHLISIR